ncbi:hypothetical protein ACWA5Z_09990 [Testudinibacter sp. P80/BLE/0925]|uniref:hypothetical protein n=1 Tax=Testudinibacter sp. TW-1 TaxID=3417757 RepID=UPI003D362C65
MPTKYVNEALWKKIEEMTISTVIRTQSMIKETEILHAILAKGLESVSESDLDEYVDKNKKKPEESI